MKIAIFTDTFPPAINGVANTAYRSAKSLLAQGHQVAIVTVGASEERKDFNYQGLEVINLPSIPTSFIYQESRGYLPLGLSLRKLKKFQPDVIHLHTPMPVGMEAVMVGKFLRTPLVGTHHTFFDHYLKHIRLDYDWMKKLSWKMTTGFYNRCDLVICPSQALADAMKEKGLASPVLALRNPVDIDFFRPADKEEKISFKKKYNLPDVSLVYMGRVSYEKSLDVAIRAFALALKEKPDLKFMIVGDGPEKDKLVELARKLSVEKSIIFTGYKTGEELIRIMQANDIFITTSKSENMPLTVLEAMAIGLSLIAVPEKGLTELVKDGVNGYLAKTDDVDDIAKKIIRFAADQALIARFGQESRNLAMNYADKEVTDLLVSAYKNVSSKNKSKQMKICLYLEFYHLFGGMFFKNIGTGLLSSYHNQRRALETLGIDFAEKWDNDCDILQINTPWLKSLYLIQKARKLGKKVIIWSHVTAEDARDVFWFNKYLYPLIKKYLKYAYGRADLVFCPSQHTKNLLLGYGLPEEKLIVQSNAVDCLAYYPDEEKRRQAREKYNCADKLVIGTVGLVIPRKRPDIFIDLAKKYPQHKFIWFGKIYSKLMAAGLPKELPSNVKFTGFVDDVGAAFNCLDIFVFLSDEENQGMVLLEAAATGLPVVVRDLPAYHGWLKHNENCLSAKNNDELFKYLDLLISDPALRDRLAQGARKLAQSEDIREQNKKLLVIYQKLLEK